MKKQTLLAAGFIALLVFSVNSVSYAGIVKKREKNQQKRIAQGVESGELNKKEAARLERNAAKIENKRERFLSDGSLSAREKAKLQHDLNRQSRAIHQQKHDKQKRDAIPAIPATPANPGVNSATPATPAVPASQQ